MVLVGVLTDGVVRPQRNCGFAEIRRFPSLPVTTMSNDSVSENVTRRTLPLPAVVALAGVMAPGVIVPSAATVYATLAVEPSQSIPVHVCCPAA